MPFLTLNNVTALQAQVSSNIYSVQQCSTRRNLRYILLKW